MKSPSSLLAVSLLIAGLAACGTDDPTPDCSDTDSSELCQPDLDAGDDSGDENDADAGDDSGDEPDPDAGNDSGDESDPDAGNDSGDESDPDAGDDDTGDDSGDEPDPDTGDEPDDDTGDDSGDEPDPDTGGEIDPGAENLKILVEWTESDPQNTVYSDLDLYYCRDGVASLDDDTCVYWGEETQEWGPGDDNFAILWTDGMDAGEIEDIEHDTPAEGRYHVGVQAYWADGSGDVVGEITATLRVLVDDVEVYSDTRVFGQSESMWYAAILDWPQITAGSGAGISEGPACVASGVNACLNDGLYDEMVNIE